MAIYHFSGTIISRSQGRSAIASAAYRSGEKLYDEKQERSMNYSRKQDVIYKKILLPANAPHWMLDREKLWNAVEKSENRKDSQLAREINFSLPIEFSKEQNIELAKEFIKNEFVARGMVADLCIHSGKDKKNIEQPHAHVMLTMRSVTENGFGLKDTSWNAKENYLLWREAWAEHVNKYLALNGIDQRIDHRSYAEQGIDLIPQNKVGPASLKDHARRLEEYQRITRENGEKLLADPSITLKVITHHQSTFTYTDIARFINGHTADVTQFQAVLEKVKALDQIVALGKDANNTERFTTKEMLVLEQKMLKDVGDLENKGHELKYVSLELGITDKLDVIDTPALLPDQHMLAVGGNGEGYGRGVELNIVNSFDSVDKNALIGDSESNSSFTHTEEKPAPSILDKITTSFLAMGSDDNNSAADSMLHSGEPKSSFTLSSQQKDAFEYITNPGDIKCLIGYAGTGKSHILKEAREVWEKNGYRVHGATLSGIAAENLEGASGINSRTLASRCYYWNTGRQLLTNKDILVIDEAGMLGTRQLARVIDEVKMHGAKLVLIGDPQQLQAIEAGAAFRAISTKVSYLELTEVRRQHEPWQQAATKEFALRDVQSAFDRYNRYDHVHAFESQDQAKASLVEMWNDVRIAQPDKTQIMLAYTNKDAQELNEIARDYRKQNNELGEDHKLKVSTGNKNFAEGDRIYFLRNNRDLGVMNGTLGNIEKIADNRLIVVIDRDNFKGNKVDANRQVVSFNLDHYNYITHGYAATIHKAQGVTVDRSYILASKHLDSHAAYVGMSRHRESADLFWSREEFNDDKALLHALSRDRSKDVALDYIQDPNKESLPGKEYTEDANEVLLKLDGEGEPTEKQEQEAVTIGGAIYESDQPVAEEAATECSAAISVKEPLEVKVDIIIKECTKLINSINYCNVKQEEFAKEGTVSPFLKECLDENKASIRQCFKDHCGRDKEILNHLKQYEPKLFNDVNKVCNNILANTIKGIESRELLAGLTKDQSELYEKVISVEKHYKELEQKRMNARKEVITMFNAGCTEAELSEPRAIRKATEEELSQYANKICNDIETTRIISQHDTGLFREMNKRFDNMFIEAIKKDELQREYINTHAGSFDKTLSKEERVSKEYAHYKETKQEYIESRKEVIKLFNAGCTEAELREPREIREDLKEGLEKYTNEICRDKDFMDYLSKNDIKEFNEMNEKFNELMREQMEEMQKELERNL